MSFIGPRSLAAAVLTVILAAGCTTTPHSIRVTRDADTDMVPGEKMVIVVTRYRHEGIDASELQSIEQTLEACVRAPMENAVENVMFLPPSDFRKAIPENTLGASGSKSPATVLHVLTAPAIGEKLAETRVRYVVLLDASYETSAAKLGTYPGQGGIFVVNEWQQQATIQATILDLKHGRVSGSVRTRSIGVEGGGMGLIYIIPVPLYVNTMAESGNCSALGKELADFFAPKI